MINVCFGLHDADGHYSKFAGTSMASIFENTSAPVTVHIFHDATLTNDNREKFSYLTGRYGQRVKFYNVERLCEEQISFLHQKLADKITSRFSIGAFYRLLIKDILGTGKAIYLDSDIIVNLDLDELWRQNVSDFPLAAVPEIDATLGLMVKDKFLLNEEIVKLEDYFNSGVMLFNLDKIYKNFFYEGVQFLADNPDCESVDQDIFNAFFSTNYLKLEQKFDSFTEAERVRNSPVAKKIYHYAGQNIGLKLNDAYSRLFLENFALTPWFNLDALYRIAEEFRNEIDDIAIKMQNMIALCMEQRRIFFVDSRNVDVLKELFKIHEDEQIIENSGEDSPNELFSALNDRRGQVMAFICLNNYDVWRQELLIRGFNEFSDFMNGLEFMTREQCGDMRSEWNLIRAL